MGVPLHLRVRGQVTGPFTKDELRLMARRGQLSRIHELSADGEKWTTASKFPELFSAEAGTMRHIAAAAPSREVVPIAAGPPQLAATPPESLLLAPVAESPAERSPQSSRCLDSSSSELPESLCRAATSSYGWAQFIAVMTMIVATLELLGGLMLMILGLDRHLASAMVSGLSSIAQAAVIATGGFLLLAYTSRLNSLRRFPSRIVLEKALDALRAYWIYVSILLIVTIAVITILAFWALSVGGLLIDSSQSHS